MNQSRNTEEGPKLPLFFVEAEVLPCQAEDSVDVVQVSAQYVSQGQLSIKDNHNTGLPKKCATFWRGVNFTGEGPVSSVG